VTASCAGTTHPLCIDFEDGKADPPWTLSTNDVAIETGNAAHGRYALHLSNLASHPTLYLQTEKMPGIDGVEVQFATPPATPVVQKAVQFVSFGIGITLYHGDSLVTYEGDTPPDLTDEWLDDIALDTTRIGCL
jgi:hypothetical protein